MITTKYYPSNIMKCMGFMLSMMLSMSPKYAHGFAMVHFHDDVIKWKHFPRYWPFMWGIHRFHKGQWRGALLFSLICARINDWVNNRQPGDLGRHRAHYDVIVMCCDCIMCSLIDWCHLIFFRMSSLALGQSHDCLGAWELILEDMGKIHGQSQ